MDATTFETPAPEVDRTRDLAEYPDEQLLTIPSGNIRLWGMTFLVHEKRTYTVAQVKVAALANGGEAAKQALAWWRDRANRQAREAAERAEWEKRRAQWAAEAETRRIERAQLNPSRTEAIITLRENGLTYAAIGEVFGVGGQRIRQILEAERRKIARLERQEQARWKTSELERAIIAELKAPARAKRQAELSHVAPATNWRTPETEYLVIEAEDMLSSASTS